MIAQIYSVAFEGIEVVEVKVQVQLATGMPNFTVVGLPDKTVAEAKERIRAAFYSLGLSLPPKRITMHLAPADLAKEGSHFDLALAIGLLAAMEVIPGARMTEYIAMGELGLDARIEGVVGVLPAAISAASMNRTLICPVGNVQEALWSGHELIVAPHHLLELIDHFNQKTIITLPKQSPISSNPSKSLAWEDIRGQQVAKRVMEIAAAGGHHMLMSGAPGTGKSMLASRLPSILPPLEPAEILETSMIYSIAGVLNEQGAMIQSSRPFRAPHHSCSVAAMIGGGGGRRVKPGEITLAHRGVLFLDEIPEFPRGVLEALRQPIEMNQITLARVRSHITYPAQFQLIAAMNPCRCGYLGDPNRACNRAPHCGTEYQSKLSGPLLDRIDLFVELTPLKPKEMLSLPPSEKTEVVAQRILQARKRQLDRKDLSGCRTNAELKSNNIEHHYIDPQAKEMLLQAMEKLQLSMRSYYRVLRVALTIADLHCEDRIQSTHIAEALHYRWK